MTIRAPGPGLAAILQLSGLRTDPLGYMEQQHKIHGDIVRLGLGRGSVHLFRNPEHADLILRRNHANYGRQTRSAAAMKLLTGESLLTNSGELWRRHRLILQPAFHREEVARLIPLFVEMTNEMLEAWSRQDGRRDLAADMMHLTFRIAGKAFFGTEVDHHAETFEDLVPLLLEETYARATSILPLYRLHPGRKTRFDAARRKLQEIITTVTASPGPPAYVLSSLLTAADSNGRPVLTDEEIRSETLALLLAGHETTANALAWTFALLAAAPDVERELRIEIERVAGDTPPTLEQLGQLSLTGAVIDEALRLYPPIWIVERAAIEDDEIGGYVIPKGSVVYVSPFVMHRHPDFWREPLAFDPTRFLDGIPNQKRASYLPFGSGPHHCIGVHFALLEARVILAMVLQRYILRPVTSTRITPQPWITLRPRGGVPMEATPRR